MDDRELYFIPGKFKIKKMRKRLFYNLNVNIFRLGIKI